MEDLFNKEQDKWQLKFRYPLWVRFLWLVAILALVAMLIWRAELTKLFQEDATRGWAALAIIALVCLFCIWTSVRAWLSFIIVSPTSIKVEVHFHGRQRIGWDNVAEVRYKGRLLGHTIILVGSDRAQVAFRSSLSKHDKLINVIRDRAPAHIAAQLDDLLGEEYEDEDEDQEGQEEPEEEREQPQHEPEETPPPPPEEEEEEDLGEYQDG